MPLKSTLDSDSDAKVALSDPICIDGEALYLTSENMAEPVSMKDNSPVVKLVSNTQVKRKTFQAANTYRQSMAQSAMAPPPIQIAGGMVQHIKPPPTDTSSRAVKTSNLLMNASRPVTGLSEIQSAVPFPQSRVALPTKLPSIQAAVGSRTIAKRSAPQDIEDDTLCDEPLAQRTRRNNLPDKPSKALSGVQGVLNGTSDQGLEDLRPKKRRRVLNEQGEDAQVPQGTDNKAEPTSSIPPDPLQLSTDKRLSSNDMVAESNDPPNISSATISPRLTTAFQKYTAEHSAILKARKAHWSTCSMETWLAGGQEIADKFSQLLSRGVYMFETDVNAFESIDRTFDEYRKEVLENRDQVLRKAKDTIISASGALVGRHPSDAEVAS